MYSAPDVSMVALRDEYSVRIARPEHREISLEFTQAILQRYGWRSFYLDASSSPEVSSWFAAHTFSSTRKLELCEDCFEDPVFLKKLAANYAYQDGQGILYVLSKQALADARLLTASS
jgi:hypothetical protein